MIIYKPLHSKYNFIDTKIQVILVQHQKLVRRISQKLFPDGCFYALFKFLFETWICNIKIFAKDDS